MIAYVPRDDDDDDPLTTTTKSHGAPRYKKGKIASGEVAAYGAYIQSLRDLAAEGAAPGFACTEVREDQRAVQVGASSPSPLLA